MHPCLHDWGSEMALHGRGLELNGIRVGSVSGNFMGLDTTVTADLHQEGTSDVARTKDGQRNSLSTW